MFGFEVQKDKLVGKHFKEKDIRRGIPVGGDLFKLEQEDWV